MALDIGKVGMIMKGAWDSSATYEVLDAVSYNNGLYVAKQAVPANTLPTNTTYWQCAVDGSDLSDDISLTFSEGITAAFKEAFLLGFLDIFLICSNGFKFCIITGLYMGRYSNHGYIRIF